MDVSHNCSQHGGKSEVCEKANRSHDVLYNILGSYVIRNTFLIKKSNNKIMK